MSEIFSVTLPFFALILCGLLARRSGIAVTSAAPALNAFVLWFALPALLVRTLGALPLTEMFDAGFIMAWCLVSTVLFGATAGLSIAVGRPARIAVIQAATATHGNVGYLGITLVTGVLGVAAIAPVILAIVIDFLLVLPAVIAAIEFTARADATPARAFGRSLRAAIANPFVIAILVGLGLSASGAVLPGPVDSFLQVLGAAAVPTALFAIGVTLYGQPLSGPLGELAVLSFLKLVVHPLLILLVMSRWLQLERPLIEAGVLLAALPVANNVFLLATRYQVRAGMVSGAILVSTTAALISFNLWAGWLLG